MFYSDFPLYDDPEEYDKTFTGSSPDEIGFYQEQIRNFKHILYLGSGTGRLLEKLLPINSSIVGVEISAPMVERAHKQFPNTEFIHQNVLDLDLKRKFDCIIAPYRFLNHFNLTDLDALFRIVHAHLHRDGTFVGDTFSPYLPHDRTVKYEIENIEVRNEWFEKIYNCYDHPNQRCTEIVEKVHLKTSEHRVITMPYHYFYPEQLTRDAEKNNFVVSPMYGSFLKQPFDQDSSELIFAMVAK